ncbi:AMP-binding protein [Microbacterium sp.]|uniref:AMP-binding protein n=1 Tax=Microbacterium sp. TaxID=51671 RepID=UPI003A856D4B
MLLAPLASPGPRDVLRALRAAVLGAGPAVALGGDPATLPVEVPAGTAVVLTTSGSTGVPKSVVLGRHAFTASALATAARSGDGAWLLALPATYVAGVQVLVRALIAGHEPAVLGGSFTPQAFAAATHGLAASRGGTPVPRYTSLVPTQLATLLDADDPRVDAALAAYEAILVGGQAAPAALLDRASARGARIVRTYGSTETSGGCVYDGVPLDGVGMRVADGEVQLSGPTLAEGYLDAALTASAFVTDGGVRWYRTGDAGEVADGALRVTGRLDNVIVSGGVNVSLDRVERAVHTVPGLEHAVVVPIDDERWGQASAVVAAVAAVTDPDAALAAARTAVAAELGAPARPARLIPVAAIPRLPNGKPDRRAARALARSAG